VLSVVLLFVENCQIFLQGQKRKHFHQNMSARDATRGMDKSKNYFRNEQALIGVSQKNLKIIKTVGCRFTLVGFLALIYASMFRSVFGG